jgi:hypothetical protein
MVPRNLAFFNHVRVRKKKHARSRLIDFFRRTAGIRVLRHALKPWTKDRDLDLLHMAAVLLTPSASVGDRNIQEYDVTPSSLLDVFCWCCVLRLFPRALLLPSRDTRHNPDFTLYFEC